MTTLFYLTRLGNTLHIHLALIPTQNFKLPEGMAMLVLFFAVSPVPDRVCVQKYVWEEIKRKLRSPLILGWLLNYTVTCLLSGPLTFPFFKFIYESMDFRVSPKVLG